MNGYIAPTNLYTSRSRLGNPDISAPFPAGAPFPPEAPSAARLVALSKSTAGMIVGSYTVKIAGGALVGLGIVFGWTGIGIGLIAAGALLWVASTAASTAALEQKTAPAVAWHLSLSLALGVASAFTWGLSFGVGATTFAGVSSWLIPTTHAVTMAGLGIDAGKLAGNIVSRLLENYRSLPSPRNNRAQPPVAQNPEPVVEYRSGLTSTDNNGTYVPHYQADSVDTALARLNAMVALIQLQEIEYFGLTNLEIIEQSLPTNQPGWAPEPSNPELVEQINSILAAQFSESRPEAIRYEPVSGTKVNLRMDKGADLITFESVTDQLNAEWIAVLRQPDPAIYDVMLSSTYEQLMTNNSTRMATGKHPLTKIPMADCLTIRGQELLTLLETTAPPVIAT